MLFAAVRALLHLLGAVCSEVLLKAWHRERSHGPALTRTDKMVNSEVSLVGTDRAGVAARA